MMLKGGDGRLGKLGGGLESVFRFLKIKNRINSSTIYLE